MKKMLIGMVLMMLGMTTLHAQWSVTPEVGMNVTKYTHESIPKVGFKAGAAVSYTFESGLFSLQSGLYYIQRGAGLSYSNTVYGKVMGEDGKEQDYVLFFPDNYNYVYDYGYGYGNYTGEIGFPVDVRLEKVFMNSARMRKDYLQLPVLARFNWKVGQDVKLHLAAGPYLAYGISGYKKYVILELSESGYKQDSYSWDPFAKPLSGKPLDWGMMLNAGIDVKGFTFQTAYDMGLGKEFKFDNIGVKYHTVSFTAGYTF